MKEEAKKSKWIFSEVKYKAIFVEQSLNTYIFKFRKNLKADAFIEIPSLNGIGYKLEVND